MLRNSNDKLQSVSPPSANSGYACFQLAKAFAAFNCQEDKAAKDRSEKCIDKWMQNWEGIVSGKLRVGSRTPVYAVPVWATLDVVQGGFATGALLAGGELLSHERSRLADLGLTSAGNSREALNAYWLSEHGQAELSALIESGNYDINVPEEGALLVVAWLLQNGKAEAARDLVDQIGPFFDRLRFYPVPSALRRFGPHVSVENVEDAVVGLERLRPNPKVVTQKETLQVWLPLYDRMVGLFLETVRGGSPSAVAPAEEESDRVTPGRYVVMGGWPCQIYPAGWRGRAQELLDEYNAMRAVHHYSSKPDRPHESFFQLRQFLQCCVVDPASLSGREVGKIRLILGRFHSKRGLPESARCAELRQEQRRLAEAPTFHQIAGVLIGRLKELPQQNGIENLGDVLQPIDSNDRDRTGISTGTAIPSALGNKIRRCRADTIDGLVRDRVITSGETLARVLPQITSDLRASGIADPGLRRLYAAIYRAFRRRRSLLLLNMQSQVRLEELPWISAIDRFRGDDLLGQQRARQMLEETATLALTAFPQAIIPNKLLQELRALAKTAQVELPLVDELAADIFMGKFSENFPAAMAIAGELLKDSLYDRYYDINYREIGALSRSSFSDLFFSSSDRFTRLCAKRAGVTLGSWDPVTNGMVIEQQQILTTQNLAVLVRSLNLNTKLLPSLEELARRCFLWIIWRHQVRTKNWHARLIMVKNTAYAWRQMVFFLSFLPGTVVRDILTWAEHTLSEQSHEFQNRFRPVLTGLSRAAAGHSRDQTDAADGAARPFVGWSKERHALLAEQGL